VGRLDWEVNDAILWSSIESPGGTRHYSSITTDFKAADWRPFCFTWPMSAEQRWSFCSYWINIQI